MNYILFSANENFKGGAKKIKIEASKQEKKCRLVEIHGVLKKNVLERIYRENSIIYVFTSDTAIPLYIKSLKNTGARIINETFLSKNYPKIILQNIAKANRVNIPKNSPVYDKIGLPNNLKYPIFIKSQKQGGMVIYTKNSTKLKEEIVSLKNIKDYYFEEAVIDKGMSLEKFYYIKGEISDTKGTNGRKMPLWFHSVLKKIYKALELEVFSVDIFIDWSKKKYFCIDINHAPGFFNSDNAREKFVRNILI